MSSVKKINKKKLSMSSMQLAKVDKLCAYGIKILTEDKSILAVDFVNEAIGELALGDKVFYQTVGECIYVIAKFIKVEEYEENISFKKNKQGALVLQYGQSKILLDKSKGLSIGNVFSKINIGHQGEITIKGKHLDLTAYNQSINLNTYNQPVKINTQGKSI